MSDNYQRHKRQQKRVLQIQGDNEKTKDQIDPSLGMEGKKNNRVQRAAVSCTLCASLSAINSHTAAGVHHRTGGEQVKEI